MSCVTAPHIFRNIYKIFCYKFTREKRRSVVNGTSFHLPLSASASVLFLRGITDNNADRSICTLLKHRKYCLKYPSIEIVILYRKIFAAFGKHKKIKDQHSF